MKVTSKTLPEKRHFIPTSITIDIENEDELRSLFYIFNVSVPSIVEKSKKELIVGTLEFNKVIDINSLWTIVNQLCKEFCLIKK